MRKKNLKNQLKFWIKFFKETNFLMKSNDSLNRLFKSEIKVDSYNYNNFNLFPILIVLLFIPQSSQIKLKYFKDF